MSEYLLWLLFSFRGRINRATFAMFFFANLALAGLVHFFVLNCFIAFVPNAGRLVPVFSTPPLAVSLGLLLLSLAMNWVTWAVHVKRLHDFGWSGWWILAPAGVLLAGGILALPLFSLDHVAVGAVLLGLASVLTLIGVLVLFCMQLFRRGDAGENGHPRGPGAINVSRHANQAPAPSATAPAAYRPGQGAPQGFGRRGVRA